MSLVRSDRFSVVSVTCPNIQQARKISKAILEEKLCACVHIVPKVESHYWWKGTIQKSNEVWMIIKTHRSKLKNLGQMIYDLHPYDVPEIIELNIDSGLREYLDWIQSSVIG